MTINILNLDQWNLFFCDKSFSKVNEPLTFFPWGTKSLKFLPASGWKPIKGYGLIPKSSKNKKAKSPTGHGHLPYGRTAAEVRQKHQTKLTTAAIVPRKRGLGVDRVQIAIIILSMRYEGSKFPSCLMIKIYKITSVDNHIIWNYNSENPPPAIGHLPLGRTAAELQKPL